MQPTTALLCVLCAAAYHRAHGPIPALKGAIGACRMLVRTTSLASETLVRAASQPSAVLTWLEALQAVFMP
jgi:hypothetical protein